MYSEDIYEVVIFSVGDTKAGTKMGKLQLKNTVDNSILNCILWEETLNRFDPKIFRTGNLVRIVSATFNERYNNCLVSALELVKEGAACGCGNYKSHAVNESNWAVFKFTGGKGF